MSIFKIQNFTNNFSVLSNLNKTSKVNAKITPSYIQKNIESLNDGIIKEKLAEFYNLFRNKRGYKNTLKITQLDDIILKLKSCSDGYIIAYIEKMLKGLDLNKKENPQKIINKIESLLDVINCANEKYTTLYNPIIPLGPNFIHRFFVGLTILFLKTFKNSKKAKLGKINDIKYPDSIRYLLECKRAEQPTNQYEQDFLNYQKFNPLEYFILKYKDSDKDLIDYLYENAYITKLINPKTQDFCRKLNKNFGIKTLDYTFSCSNSESMYRIEKELEMFYKLLKPKTSLFDLLKISKCNSLFFDKEVAGAYNSRKIFLPYWQKGRVFRHELIHAIDPNKGIHSDRTIPKKLIEEELSKLGIKKYTIEYANSSMREAKATLGEYYSPKYSSELKDFMVKNGLPKEILGLADIDFYDYLISSKNWASKELKIFNKIRKRFNGIIPQDICNNILTIGSDGLENLTALLSKRKTKNNEHLRKIYENYADIVELKKEIKKIENTIHNLTKDMEERNNDRIKESITDFRELLKEVQEDLKEATKELNRYLS